MEKIEWTFITTVGSITLGWFLNELGQLFRTRKEEKKILKKVLYHLLETYFTFNQLDTSQVTQIITDRIKARIPGNQQKIEFEHEFKKFFPRIVKELFQTDIADRLKKIEVEFTKSIDSLSSVDPIKAYRLNGKTNIIQTFDLLQESMNKLIGQFQDGIGQDNVQNQIDSTIELLKPKILNEAIGELESEIFDLALAINLPTWLRVKQTIKRIKNRLKTEGENRIDDLLDKLINKI